MIILHVVLHCQDTNYILIDAMEDECERAAADDYEKELEEDSDRYINDVKILERLQILLGK